MPALFILPLVIVIINQVAHVMETLVDISGHLIILPIVALVALTAITGVMLLLRAIFGR